MRSGTDAIDEGSRSGRTEPCRGPRYRVQCDCARSQAYISSLRLRSSPGQRPPHLPPNINLSSACTTSSHGDSSGSGIPIPPQIPVPPCSYYESKRSAGIFGFASHHASQHGNPQSQRIGIAALFIGCQPMNFNAAAVCVQCFICAMIGFAETISHIASCCAARRRIVWGLIVCRVPSRRRLEGCQK